MPTGPANFETIYWQLISIIWNLRLSLRPRRMFWYILDIMHCQYYADSLQTSTQILSSCCHGKLGKAWDYYTNNLQTSKHHCGLSKIFPKFMIDVTGKTNQATPGSRSTMKPFGHVHKHVQAFLTMLCYSNTLPCTLCFLNCPWCCNEHSKQ